MAALTKALNPIFARVGKKGVKNWNFGMPKANRAKTLSDVIPMAKGNLVTIKGKTYMKKADGKWYLRD